MTQRPLRRSRARSKYLNMQQLSLVSQLNIQSVRTTLPTFLPILELLEPLGPTKLISLPRTSTYRYKSESS